MPFEDTRGTRFLAIGEPRRRQSLEPLGGAPVSESVSKNDLCRPISLLTFF